jgi:PBSX family phage terminase large subunit
MVSNITKGIPCPRGFLPKQKLVLDAIFNKHKRYVLYSGAYGAGKTLLMTHAIIRYCIKYPGVFVFFGAQTVPLIRNTVIRTFMEEIDLYQKAINKKDIDLQLTKKWKPSINMFTFFNGSEVFFSGCDDPMKLKSLNLDAFALDEPVDIDEQIFLMLQGRLRANHAPFRFAIMAGNPSGKTNWVYRKFFDNPTKEYFAVHTTTYENKYLPKDYIPSMEDSYDEEYKRRYLYGEWGSFEGQVYKDFYIDKHVKELPKDPNKYSYTIAGYDDGYRNPACFLSIGVDSNNNIYVFDEYYRKQETTDELVNMSLGKEKKYKFNRIYADPSAINFIETGRNKGLHVYGADNDVEKGISKIKAMFNNDMIYIDPSCENTIREVEGYHYGKDGFNKNLTEKPVKKDDHAPDALRYALTDFNPFKQKRNLGSGSFA